MSSDPVFSYRVPGLSRAVSSLVATVVTGLTGEESPPDSETLDATAAIIMKRLVMMPHFLGYPMMMATVFFDAAGFFFAVKPFHSQSLARRTRQIRKWRSFPVSFFGNFVDFYEKMSTFVYFSYLEEHRGCGKSVASA
ncbi:MAG: hypothetical protein RDV48_00120 [Candidatus Eremiobacteraeota bacterium]|nr:hypothetical protein [Candidatus Eremiobacteraeota bacterium]